MPYSLMVVLSATPTASENLSSFEICRLRLFRNGLTDFRAESLV